MANFIAEAKQLAKKEAKEITMAKKSTTEKDVVRAERITGPECPAYVLKDEEKAALKASAMKGSSSDLETKIIDTKQGLLDMRRNFIEMQKTRKASAARTKDMKAQRLEYAKLWAALQALKSFRNAVESK